jgi:hypothetical protein
MASTVKLQLSPKCFQSSYQSTVLAYRSTARKPSSLNTFAVCLDTGCSFSLTFSLDDFEFPPTQGDFGTIRTITGTTRITAFGIVVWKVYDSSGAEQLI